MQEEYKVKIFFDDNGITLNDLMTKFLLNFLNADFDIYNKYDMMESDIVQNL